MGRMIDADKLRKQMSEDYAQSVSKISNPAVKAIVEKAVETFDGYVVSAETVEAIPTAWIEAEIKKLRDMDNGFASLSAGQIEAMLKKWREEQNVRKPD
jgi:hypothetical protein